MKFTPQDRVMIVAAHPDDETLAAGGLIQEVVKAGARGRVLMVTSGDNNPWPQRWLERRWHIGPPERERWGAMRRGEALAALETLGFNGETIFLGFPDQGLTGALLQNDPGAMDCLCAALREWNPTWLVLPSPGDLHPDHNALHVLLQIALYRIGLDIPQLHYAVHCVHRELIPRPLTLPLDEAQCRRKHDAILCHKSQMILSSSRFLAYAQPGEGFFEPPPVQAAVAHHPVAEARLEADELHLAIKRPFSLRSSLWIVAETAEGKSLRWQMALPFASGKAAIRDCVTGTLLGKAVLKTAGPLSHITVPMAGTGALALLYVKSHRPAIFLDPSGWRQVPVK